MLRDSLDGERLLSTSRTNIVPGEWVAFELPTGRPVRPGEDAAEKVELRLEQGQSENELVLTVRNGRTVNHVIMIRPGRTTRIDRVGTDKDRAPIQLEITVEPASKRR